MLLKGVHFDIKIVYVRARGLCFADTHNSRGHVDISGSNSILSPGGWSMNERTWHKNCVGAYNFYVKMDNF